MPNLKRLYHAAQTILTHCLALPPEGELAIIADETTLKIASLIAGVAEAKNHRTNLLYWRSSLQSSLAKTPLGISTLSTLQQVAATIICVNRSAECLGFRDQIRRAAWGRGHRVAHMPGATWESILAADTDYVRLSQTCQDLALVLAKGHALSVETVDRHSRVHRLHAKLAPWRRLPAISDGIIRDAGWGNVPSGETYIAPLERTTEGTIVINGSLPGMILAPHQELLLHFRAGRLTRVEPETGPAAQHLFDSQFRVAQAQGDSNWNNLAEIGLGANEQIKRLTGSPLLDEKMYGTLHIALGDSTDMGGEVSSVIHCDLVCRNPHVRVDGKSILAKGKIVLAPELWREDYRSLRLPRRWAEKKWIRRTVVEAKIDEQGRLRRKWDASAGGVSSVPVGEDASAVLAAHVWQLLKEFANPTLLTQLEARLVFNSDALSFGGTPRTRVHHLVHLLERYGLVEMI